jgi:FkbM family methyltransferase
MAKNPKEPSMTSSGPRSEGAPVSADPLSAPVTRDDVIYGYRMLFGRDPESEMAIRHHLSAHADVGALRDMLIAHSQFRASASGPRMERSKWVMTEIFGGCRLWLDLHDVGVSRGCLLGQWEESETRLMRAGVRKGDTVFDIGANIGWFTLLAATRCGVTGHVHAFEPHPVISRYLRRSVVDSHLDPIVTVHELALDEADGQATLGAEVNTANPGHNHFLADSEQNAAGFERHLVARRRLDDLLPEAVPQFIKMDVEGAEMRVLRGARALLKRARPRILSELFPEQLASVSGATAADFIAEMAKLGYGCWELGPRGLMGRLDDFPTNAAAPYVSVVFDPV